jgi:hypothetical protein
MAWHANIIRRSAGLGSLLSSEDPVIATEYYEETVKGFQNAKNANELIELLDEFSNEVMTDLELKEYSFRSRELIVNCMQLINDLTTLPAIMKLEKGKQVEIFPSSGNRIRLAEERERSAQLAAVNPFKSKLGSGPLLNTTTAATTSVNSPKAKAFIRVDSSSSFLSDSSFNFNAPRMSMEQEQRLKIVAVNRLKVIFSAIKVTF